MARRITILTVLLAMAFASTSACAYDFWGVTMGTQSYMSGTQLTFDGLSSTNIQYVVGGYKYTRVDSTWYGPFDAASPGAGYAVSRKVDAQALFFMPDAGGVKIMVITGTPQTGIVAPECGYENRLFGPGDLKIDVGGHTFGVGLRLDDLLWAVNPATSNASFKIYKATGGTDSIYARDDGTLGRVEEDPRWDHVDHTNLAAYDDDAYAFFVKGSGSLVGSADVIYHQNTGVSISGVPVYAYEITVPWATLGLDPNNYSFTASWRPDCGNDLIMGSFSGQSSVPEPGSIIAILTGIIGMAGYRRRR